MYRDAMKVLRLAGLHAVFRPMEDREARHGAGGWTKSEYFHTSRDSGRQADSCRRHYTPTT